MIFKYCNRLLIHSNRLQVNMNIGIQIQLWRVTTFHKIHCVIDYTIMVIDYQWMFLKKMLRVITLNMVFSKGVKVLKRHFRYTITQKNTSDYTELSTAFLLQNLCQIHSKFLFNLSLKKGKFCKNKNCAILLFFSYSSFLLPLAKRIQRTNRLRILLIPQTKNSKN